MENRGQKRSETIDELPADKRTCSSLEFRPSSSSSVSPIETPTNSTNHTQDQDMETSSSASASGSGGSHEDREDSAYGSCDSDEMGDGENRRQREALRDIQIQRLSGHASRFKDVFKNLNEKSDESTQQAALHELCEILSFSADSTLSSVIADALSPTLIKLAGHQSNPEIMLLSIRALTYLCDIYPRSAAFIVKHNGVRVLCQKLLAIEYEDVAEQCLLALEKISREQPLACLQSGAIMAVLTYIDFFSTSIQRIALSTVVNICQKLPSEGSSYMDAVPTLCKLLQYEDNQLVEHVANCLIKITEQVYERPNMLDELSKHGLIHQVAHLINLKSHTTLSQSVHTGLIGLLVKLASGSMIAVEALFDLNISSILKDILSTYDLSHGTPSPRAFDGQDNQVHEVLKLLIQLVPVVTGNHDVQLAEEKAAFLTNNPHQLQTFGNDMLPVLIQVVDSGVDLSICYGCLSVIDKLLYYMSSDTLLDLFKRTNISRFLAGVFTRKDRHVLMLALNISDTILKKDGDVFMGPFIKEGVLFAIDALISPEKGSQFMFSMFNDIHLSNRSSHKQCLCYSFNVIPSSESQSKSCKLEKDSVQTLAKHVRTYYFDLNSSTSANGRTDILEKLKSLSVELASVTDGMVEDEYDQVLNRIMSCLDGEDVISTFEFVESGITESLYNYLSPGECSRKSNSFSSCSKSQSCISEQRLETFGRLFWSKFSLASFISKLQSALSSVEDFPVFLNGVFKDKRSYATIPNRHATTYPCLKVLFEKGEGELALIDYSGDLQSVDPFSDFDALEKYLWPKVRSSNNTKGVDETGSNGQSSSDSSQQNIGQTEAESVSGNETQHDPMDYEMTAAQNDSDISTDGQLSFYLEGKQIDRGLTIYQAVLKHHKEEYDTITHSTMWNQIHKITYKKSPIFDRSSSPVSGCHTCLLSEFGSSVKKSTPCHNILFLLRILEDVNRFKSHIMSRARICDYAEGRISELDGVKPTSGGISKNEFVNTRLTEKLEQQLRDTLATSAGGMPSWCEQLMTSCPFLFSFETRSKYFKLSALGKHQGQRQSISRSGSDSENESPRSRKKFLVYRDRVLESATKMMNLHASQKVVLEVKYDNEVGTGLGPTLEFFTLVSNEFQKPGLGMWRGDNLLSSASLQTLGNPDSVIGGSPFGLFPGPWCPCVRGVDFSEVRKKFVLLGQIVAKALYDGRVLDLPFTKAFYKLILGQELTVYDIKSFDPVLGKTLIEFQALVERRKYLQSVGGNSAVNLDLCFRDTKIDDLHLDFTLPGYPDFILGSGPDKEMVNTTNLGEYIELVVDATIKSGISKQMEAFKSGFNEVFSIDHLQIFTDEELERLLCGESETWNPNQLLDLVKFDHGYTSSSPPILHFLEVIQEFDYEQQKAFVKFVTGAPRLPLGGLASLNPKLTIVRKHCDKFVDADLPSVMTCANYLKLPPYSSKQIMKEKLLYAITEGQGSFHLS